MTELTGRIAQLRDENERFLRAAARAYRDAIRAAEGLGTPGTAPDSVEE